MDNEKSQNQTEILRLLPSVDVLLRTETAQKLVLETGNKHLTILARSVTDALRKELQEKISNNESVNSFY